MLFSPKMGIPAFRLSPSPAYQPFNTTLSTEKPGKSSPLRGRTTTPRSKLRHEDSQIQFEAINSSPLIDQESQLFTDRQREVAERQRLDAPMFSDISSPARRRALEISSDPLNSDAPEERPSTPLLQPALDDDLPGSSPTVASVSRRQSLSRRFPPEEITYGPWRDDEDIPSSPPRGDEEEEEDSSIRAKCEGTSAALRRVTISPMRLQSNRPEDSSHDILLEKARKEFAMVSDDLSVSNNKNFLPPLSTHRDEEPRSSLDRELVNAQIAAEVLVSSGKNTHGDEETHRGDTPANLTSSMVADSTKDKQEAVKSMSSGSTTDPISSDAFVVHAIEPLCVNEALSEALTSTLAASPGNTQGSNADATGVVDDSRIEDSFSHPEFEQEVLGELSLAQDQAVRKGASHNVPDISSGMAASLVQPSQLQGAKKRKRGRPSRSDQAQLSFSTESSLDQDQDTLGPLHDLQEDEPQLPASMDSASQSQYTAKRKPGRPKRIKTDDFSYLMGIGNPPVRPPVNCEVIFDDDTDKLDHIVFKQTLQEQMDSAGDEEVEDNQLSLSQDNADRPTKASSQLVDTTSLSTKPSLAQKEIPAAVVPGPLDTRNSKIPPLGRRSSSRLSQMFMDNPETRQSPNTETAPLPVPSLSRRQSSRLLEVSMDSLDLEQSSLGIPKTQLGIRKYTSPNLQASAKERLSPTEQALGERRTSGRFSQTPNNPEFADGLPPVRRQKRSLSQSQHIENHAAEESIVSPKISISKRRKLNPDRPRTNLRSSQSAFVRVTPGDSDSRIAGTEFIVSEDEGLLAPSADKAVQPAEALGDSTEPLLQTTPAQRSRSYQDANERSILTPRSILARLKSIVSDCKSMVFGSQEQREMDDVLFEVKTEVFRKREP
jgi:hypothetical protein